MSTETTWKALVDEVSVIAQDAGEDYIIFQRNKTYNYMPSEEWRQKNEQEAFPGRARACVFGHPIIERGEVVCTYQEIDDLYTIHDDKVVRRKIGRPKEIQGEYETISLQIRKDLLAKIDASGKSRRQYIETLLEK